MRRSSYLTVATVQKHLEEGEVVCGVLDVEGRPHYFAAPQDADFDTMNELAFRALHDRGPTDFEERMGRIRNQLPMRERPDGL